MNENNDRRPIQSGGARKTVVAVSGYFNPIHVGHIKLFRDAKALGDKLVVILNNDDQVGVKGTAKFMSQNDRAEIVRVIRYVDEVFISIDKDISVAKSLRAVKPDIFANGGDRSIEDVPVPKAEDIVSKELGIKMVYNVGGKKLRSSSEILKKVAPPSA